MKISDNDLFRLQDGEPPMIINPDWDIETVITSMAVELLELRSEVEQLWISVKDRLPVVLIDSKGHCNVVLVKWAIKIECGSQYQTSNTAYVNKYPEKFTHWMPLPKLPEVE